MPLTAPLPNRILRETVDIHFYGGRDGLAVRRQMEDLCTQRLTCAIGELLDSWGIASDQLISIDRLEVTVDGVSSGYAESELIGRIVSALRVGLEANIGSPGSLKTKKLRPLRRSLFEQVLFFLDRGHLPWSSGGDAQWAAAAAEVLSELETEDRRQLVEKLGQAGARQRLARHFPEPALRKILPPWCSDPERKAILADAERILGRLPPGSAAMRLRERWVRILLDAVILGDPGAPRAVCQALAVEFTKLEPSLPPIVADLQSAGMRREFSGEKVPSAPEPAFSGGAPEGQAPLGADTREPLEIQNSGVSKTPGSEFDDPNTDQEAARIAAARRGDTTPKRSASNREVRIETEPIYIGNGGLVILAPYLPALFRKLELSADEGLRDVSSALVLLHYLVFGTDECAEWELVLNKIVCGVPPAYSLETPPALSPEQKAECDRLLQAVIANWPALKKTSPDGLRQAFLQREGALSQEGGNWKLRLTRTSFDVLTDQLPWTISMIRLSWMPWLLQTDWAG